MAESIKAQLIVWHHLNNTAVSVEEKVLMKTSLFILLKVIQDEAELNIKRVGDVSLVSLPRSTSIEVFLSESVRPKVILKTDRARRVSELMWSSTDKNWWAPAGANTDHLFMEILRGLQPSPLGT